jgi:Flp pilus assembly protein TadD
VRLTRERYDLIMNDSIWPHLPGCSGLYTREYFADARERLAPGGIMTSWLPLELSEEAFATVIATFRSAFPHSTLWAMSAGQSKHALLVGTPEPLRLDAREIARRIDGFGLREELSAVGISSAEDLLGAMLLDEEALATLAAGAETSSRDRPILEFMASRRRAAGARTRMAANLTRIAGAIGDADGPRGARRQMLLGTARGLEESVRAEPLAREGDSAYNARRYADAARAYARALEVAPSDWRLHLRLGRALTFSGRAGEALRSYRRSAELRPFETEAWWALVAGAPPEEAARAYEKVRALDPNSAEKLRFVRPELAR